MIKTGHRFRTYTYLTILLISAVLAGCGGLGKEPIYNNASNSGVTMVNSKEFKSGATLSVTSESLNDGVWDDDISNQGEMKNETPQLSFGRVDGALCYAIYMLDESADNWLHWKAEGVTSNSLEHNTSIPTGTSEYIGPYPPSGTHTYTIYVFALKQEPDKDYPGDFNKAGMDAEEIYSVLDITDNSSGNVLAYGYLEGTYESKKN
jgi:phosphatidylethanolamine-binding protein (PEBP) family uncharacterized protein